MEIIEMQITPAMLHQYPLLNVLSDDELTRIIPLVRVQAVNKDECLYLEGESSNKLFFVVEGWFKAEKTSSEGRQATLRFIGPGEIINELSIFPKVPNVVTVMAMEPAMILYLLQDDIEHFFRNYPKLSRAVIERLANRIQHLLDHVEGLSLYTVEARLARFLLAQTIEDVWERQQWITQSEIAARLGTVLDVVNRNLQKFVKDGIIEIHRDKIIILDRNRLEMIARG